MNFKEMAWALTTNESARMRKLLRLMNVSILKTKHSDDGSSEYYQHLAWAAYGAYLRIKYMQAPAIPRYIDEKRGLGSFDEIDCWTFFKCKKADIGRFFRVLKFPDRCVFDSRISMSGEEVFCRGMYEVVSASRPPRQSFSIGL